MEQRNHPQTMGTTKEKDGMSKRRKTQNNLVDNLLKYLTEFISLWKYAMPCRKTVKIKNSSSKSEDYKRMNWVNKQNVCVCVWVARGHLTGRLESRSTSMIHQRGSEVRGGSATLLCSLSEL